jgi:hypothetical protein
MAQPHSRNPTSALPLWLKLNELLSLATLTETRKQAFPNFPPHLILNPSSPHPSSPDQLRNHPFLAESRNILVFET